jgi:L-asparagine transporter-like permease
VRPAVGDELGPVRLQPHAVRLARAGDAPNRYASLDRRGVPQAALLLSGALAGAGILVAVVSPDTAFLVLLGAASSVLVPLYLILAVAQLRMRRHWEAHDPSRLTVRMWWFPYGTYLLIATTLAIAAALVLLPEFLPQAVLTAVAVLVVAVAHAVRRRRGRGRAGTAGRVPTAAGGSLS